MPWRDEGDAPVGAAVPVFDGAQTTGPAPGMLRTMPHAPFFHEDSGTVRFWVEVDAVLVGASISRAALHYRYGTDVNNEDPLQTYVAHSADIDAAVRRRVAQGSIEPVMVREHDLRAVA